MVRLEPGSYSSLSCKFCLQFILFVVGVLVASGILYAIDKDHVKYKNISFTMAQVEAKRLKRVERLLNQTGIHVVRDFGDKHNVEVSNLNGFIQNMTRVFYFGKVDINLSRNFLHYIKKEEGMNFREAYVLTLSTVTTVGE